MESTSLSDYKASCLHYLRRSNAIRRGIRRSVRYLPNKVKEGKPKMLLIGESESESKVGGGSSKQAGMTESEVEERMAEVRSLNRGKRLREDSSVASDSGLKKIAGRWSVERCESAKKSLLEVVREMDATWQKPVLLHDLREKARKHIGDTGLLDHLLKHMAGVAFADGKERLIRRHNSEGAIEYWLEPAELAGLRQEAGISDAYWNPPPGWKLGDAVTDYICDGHCKELIYQSNEEINVLKSEITELECLKQTVKSQQEKHRTLLMEHRKLEEQIGELISIYLMAKEDIYQLKEENEKRRKEMLDMRVKETSVAGFSGEKHTIKQKEKGKHMVASGNVGIMEQSARKRSFRVCRPDGTFLWPSMTSTSSYSSHSMSSATAQAHQLIVLPSPTSSLPPLPAFFCQQQPDGCKQVQSFSQAQSHSVLAQSPGHGMARQPTARYPSEGMMNSGANNRVVHDVLALKMAPDQMNTEKTDVVTDLALSSFNY